MEFAKHSGETLLGLGNGLGTDWLQYARHGAAVIVCSSSAEQLALTRRNFELGVWTESGPMIDAVLEQFNALWEGRRCDGCGRKDVCPVPLEEPDL